MFSRLLCKCRRPGGHAGYSLLELLVSILLIAGIAVLSLPTFQEFSPHGEFTADPTEGQVERPAEARGPLSRNSVSKDQPVDRPVSKNDVGEEPERREESRAQ